MTDVMTQEDAMNMDERQAIQILEPMAKMMLDQHGCPISSAYFALQRAIEALSDPLIVRCKDCVEWKRDTVRQNSNDAGWWNEAVCDRHTIYGNEPHKAWTSADWYCADGERRSDDQP